MLNFIKKQSIATWVSILTLLLAVVALIVYGVNVGGAGYFNGSTVSSVVTCGIIALVVILVALVMSQFAFEGLVGKVYGIVLDALRILVPLLLFIGMFAFISSRVEGLAYIYFSNEEILATIQTPENLASAHSAIAGFILFGVAALVGIVAAFFTAKKKQA